MWQKVTFAGTCLVLSGALVMAQAPTRQIAPDPQQLQTQQQQTQQQQAKEPAHVQGQIVRVDPQTSTVVVRTSNGDKSVDREFKVETGTQYFGADHKPFFDGLTNWTVTDCQKRWDFPACHLQKNAGFPAYSD